MNRRLFWIAFSCVITFISMGYLVFALIAKPQAKSLNNNENNSLTNSMPSGQYDNMKLQDITSKSAISNEEKISPNCNLIVETYYNKCGHVLTVNKIVPMDLVNLTKEQLIAAYRDYTVISFSANEVKLSIKADEKCPQHYILKEKDGRVTIFYQQPINNISIKKETNILVERLPLDDIEKLKKGIEVNSDEELASFLEDLGS